MRNIVFIAPPAAGKGTQANILKENYNIAHISTGDLLREEVKKESLLGKQIEDKMKSGQLIEDEIVTELLENRLMQDDTNNGYILDGYPRNIKQAKILEELLEKINKPIDHVIFLEIDEEEAMKRACGRLTCDKCGKIYNIYFDEMKPKKENICDDCNISLTHRADDNEESFKKRFRTYMESTKPLIDFYQNKGLLNVVDSSINKEHTSKQIKKILK